MKFRRFFPHSVTGAAVLLALTLTGRSFGQGPLVGGHDYLWQPPDSPTDTLWSDMANWQNAATGQPMVDPSTGLATDGGTSLPPGTVFDRVILGYSNTPSITIDSLYNIDSIAIGGSGGEPVLGTSYLGGSGVLTLSGAGFISNPYSVSPTLGSLEVTGSGKLQLTNSANLGQNGIDNYATLVFANSASAGSGNINVWAGTVSFENNATGALANITNHGTIQLLNNATLGAGPASNTLGNMGTLNFYDATDTGGRSINNSQYINFYGNSTALSSTIQNTWKMSFYGSSTAATSHITNGGLNTPGAAVMFYNTSTAASATLDNYYGITFNDAATSGSAQINNHTGSTLTFNGSSTAGGATISNSGTMALYGTSSAGNSSITNNGALDFYESSTGGSATINESGGTAVTFHDNASAGSSTITSNDSSSVTFLNNSTAGNSTLNNNGSATFAFRNSSNAGSGTINNNGTLLFRDQSGGGHSTIDNSSNGNIYFHDQSNAKHATIQNNGVLDLSASYGGISVGALSGTGSVFLGSNSLTVGGLGTDSGFSGQIQDGGISSGSGGSLVKIGAGIMELSGNNSYTGGTTVEGGTLRLVSTGNLQDYSSLTMAGGNLVYYNAGSPGLKGQVFGQVTFSQGGSGIQNYLDSGAGAGTKSYIVMDSLSRSTGATGMFSVINQSASGKNAIVIGTNTGSIVSGTGINGAAEHAAGVIDPGVFVSGSGGVSYAWYDPVGTNGQGVRALNYSTDAGAYTTGATASITTGSGIFHAQATGAVTAQQTAVFTTLNIASANDFTLANGTTLYIQSILKTGGGTSTISGGTELQATLPVQGGGGNELIFYTDQGSTLNVDTTIAASAVTVSGSGQLNLNNNYSGQLYLNGGGLGTSGTIAGNVSIGNSNLTLGNGGRINGNVTVSAGGSLNGSGVVNGNVTLSQGGSLGGATTVGLISGAGTVAPGDPMITTGTQVDTSGGLSFAFQFTKTGSPIYGNATASGNDVLHITGSTPFAMQLGAGNQITVDFSGATLAPGQLYLGGFYTDAPGTTNSTVFSGTPNIVYTGTDGFTIQYDGFVTDTANFGSGPVNGEVMKFEVVPEPSTYALFAAGLLLMVVCKVRRRGCLG